MGHGYNYKADIWSIGILICEMMGGFIPFGNKDEDDNLSILDQIRLNQINLPKNLNNIARDIIKNLLIVDPNQRFEI
jgi:serine/threonine protein kinase